MGQKRKKEFEMRKLILKVKVNLGIPVKMTGKEFIDLNKKVFLKNDNLEQQINFLKENNCYDKVGSFKLSGGRVGIPAYIDNQLR